MLCNITDLLLCLGDNNDKTKPAERRGRKATGPRFLREVMADLPKGRKIAGLPQHSSLVRVRCPGTPPIAQRVEKAKGGRTMSPTRVENQHSRTELKRMVRVLEGAVIVRVAR